VAQIVAFDTYEGAMKFDMVVATSTWTKEPLSAIAATAMELAVMMPMTSIFVIGALPNAVAYSVAGVGHHAHAPAIYSAMNLGARAKLDLAVWAPVESSFIRQHNGTQSAEWAWGEVCGYASDVMQQIAGRVPLKQIAGRAPPGMAVSQRETENSMWADSGMARGKKILDS